MAHCTPANTQRRKILVITKSYTSTRYYSKTENIYSPTEILAIEVNTKDQFLVLSNNVGAHLRSQPILRLSRT